MAQKPAQKPAQAQAQAQKPEQAQPEQAQPALTEAEYTSYEARLADCTKRLVLDKEAVAERYAQCVLIISILALAQIGRLFTVVLDNLTAAFGKAEARKIMTAAAVQCSRIERSFAHEAAGYDYSIIVASTWNEAEKKFKICLNPAEIYARIAELKELLAMRHTYLPRIKPDKFNLVKAEKKTKAEKPTEQAEQAQAQAQAQAQPANSVTVNFDTVTSAEACNLIRKLINRIDSKLDALAILAVIETTVKKY